MSAAFDIATLINDKKLGTLARDLFVNRMPETPDEAIAVYEYGGKPTEFAMGSSPAVEHASVQVAVRNGNARIAQENCYGIYRFLDGWFDDDALDGSYYLITALQPPFKLDEDERNRMTFAFNVQVKKRRT